ncbi:transglycosylase family protein [Candidatus Curtissbacteria bacterium]|nr:transglycosylase family protein [Candidatus Curtissbacteria bacterium]
MAARKHKKNSQISLKLKLATYLLGVVLVLPILNTTTKALAKTEPIKLESGVIVAAAYRNELQDQEAKVQENTISYAQVEPSVRSAPAMPTPMPINTGDDAVWDKLAACESGGNWNTSTGNGYYGGIQFSQGSWNAVGGSGSPSQATREEQIQRGKILLAHGGWGNWPTCSRSLGLI